MDPEKGYDSDKLKAFIAKLVVALFAKPANYIVRISWSDTCILDANGNFTSGWFAPPPLPFSGGGR